jgi:hydroxymethylpyrimidine pyrophosphatase-like HAD family hydrolase
MISGCSTPTANYTKYQKEIDMKQEKLQEDAKDFIATAKSILSKTDLKRSEIKRAIDIIEKSQTLLGGKIDDGSEFKNLEEKEQEKAIQEAFNESKKDLSDIENLEEKDKELVAEIVTDNIEAKTIKDYERKKTIKLYAIFGIILSSLGALFYFFPTKFLSIGAKIVGFFVK